MGLPIAVAPPRLLPVLADIVGGEVFFLDTMVFSGGESQRGKQQPRLTECLPEGKDQEKHLLSSTVPTQPDASFQHKCWPQTMPAAGGMPLYWACVAPPESCAATQALSVGISSTMKAHGSHSVLSLWTIFFAFYIRSQLSDIKQKLSQARRPAG